MHSSKTYYSFVLLAALAALSSFIVHARPSNRVQEDSYDTGYNGGGQKPASYDDYNDYGSNNDYGGNNDYGNNDYSDDEHCDACDSYGSGKRPTSYGGQDEYEDEMPYGGKTPTSPYGGRDDYGEESDDYSYGDEGDDSYGGGAKKPCKCDCEKTPVYEMDDACRLKCVKPTATATKPCTTPTPTPTKPCTTTTAQYQPTLHVGASPINESRPQCTPVTVTRTQTQVQYKTLTATQTVVHTSIVTSVKVVPTTVVKHETQTIHNTATVTKTCTQTSTVHDTVYKTVTKESTKTMTVGAQPTHEAKEPCHECEKTDYAEVKPTATSDYPTVAPSAVKSDYGYPSGNDNTKY
jgi:hypothetical protein